LIRVEGRHDGRRILLQVAILRSDNPADLTHRVYTGLLDTGATTSWISPNVIDGLGLVELMKDRVSFAMSEQMAAAYLFRVGLFADGSTAGSLPYVFAETRGFRLSPRPDFDVILGMDILSQGTFGMLSTGNWHLEFGR
jgi:hypothetical protein